MLSQNPGVLGKFKICRILPESPPIRMLREEGGFNDDATFPQIKPTKINLPLFGR